MFKRAIPVLHVSRSAVAAQVYCEGLGFQQRFAYRPDDPKPDPCYMGLSRDGVLFHVSSFLGDGVPGGVATFIVDDPTRYMPSSSPMACRLTSNLPCRVGATVKCT